MYSWNIYVFIRFDLILTGLRVIWIKTTSNQLQARRRPISSYVGAIDIRYLYRAYRGDMEYLEFRPSHSQDIARYWILDRLLLDYWDEECGCGLQADDA